MRLRALLAGHFTDEQLKQQMLKLGQFSSIGSLGEELSPFLFLTYLPI
jgi:hypothetical protein